MTIAKQLKSPSPKKTYQTNEMAPKPLIPVTAHSKLKRAYPIVPNGCYSLDSHGVKEQITSTNSKTIVTSASVFNVDFVQFFIET